MTSDTGTINSAHTGAAGKILGSHHLDAHSLLPLYHQLKQIIIAMIESGELGPGDVVPSEHVLEKAYGVSRTTIGRAMDDLEREGYISRQRGRGTLVSIRPVYHGTTGVAGFSDDMSSQGITPSSKVLSVTIVCADEKLAQSLHCTPGADVLVVHRVRLADGKPACIELNHLPVAQVGMLSPADLEGEKSLYTHFRERLGINPQAAEEVLEIAYATAEEAKLLRIPVSSAVVRLQRTVFAPNNACIEYSVSTWRSDRFRYVAWRSGSSRLSVRKDAE